MPSSSGRGIAIVFFVFTLMISASAYAATTTPAQLINPFAVSLPTISPPILPGTSPLIGHSSTFSTSTTATSTDTIQILEAEIASLESELATLHTPTTTSQASSVAGFNRPLAIGSTGADVTALQTLLTKAGFFNGPVTGYFGPLTQAAVTVFQTHNGLEPVGSVGPKTRALLNATIVGNGSPSSATATTSSTASSTTPATATPAQSVIPLSSPTIALTFGTGGEGGGGGSSSSGGGNNSSPDTTPPSASLTVPSNGATVGGSSVTLTAAASDNVAVAKVQFKVDGSNIGSAITSSPYTTTWNSTGVSDGPHSLYAVAEDTSGNYATSSISVTVRNGPPVISAISSGTPTATTTTITWTTDEPATSQINFGTTTSYGNISSSAVLTTSHSITLSSLASATTYHFQVESVDNLGNTATSTDQAFTTATNFLPGAVGEINMFASPKNFEIDWTLGNVGDTSFSTKTIAPDGTDTGEKFIENTATSAYHVIDQEITKPSASVEYTETIWAKQAGRTRIVLAFDNPTENAGTYVVFDLVGGQVGVPITNWGNGSYVGDSATIESAGDGWYRCQFIVTTDSYNETIVSFRPDGGSGTQAIDQQYTGDGSSGVYIWQASLVPAAAWSYSALPFSDNFTSTSTIDINDTRAPGYNWYVHNSWPTGGDWLAASSTQPGDISLSSDGLALATDRSGFSEGLNTAVTNGGSGYIGQAFGGGFYFQTEFKYDPTLALSGMGAWPTIWLESVEGEDGSSSDFVEKDVFEAYPTGTGTLTPYSNLHEWGRSPDGHYETPDILSITPDSNFHTIGILWVPTSLDQGTGLYQVYWDGVEQTNVEVTYSTSSPALPGASPDNPDGLYSVADNQLFSIIIGAGPNWPITVKYADLWQQ
jgi:peptidoglycan hydrolase-like protein with peptidoglycan-binding domain